MEAELPYTETLLAHETPDPAALYLHIFNRIREAQAMGEKVPVAEGSLYFKQLMTAVSQLISENERLRAALHISAELNQDLEIENTIKDIELFNFTNQSEQKDK